MDAVEIGELIIGAIVGVMAYFLKMIHGDVRQNTKDVGTNKGRIENLQTQISHESEMRNQALKQIFDILGEIKEDIKGLKK